jgi:tetratricopeptide (TPR) repeat protein
MAQTESRKKALIIAVSEYDENSNLKELPFCKNDGNEILTLLKDSGYAIKNQDGLIGRVDGRLMQERIYRFFGDDDIKSDDTLLFYFSGHGVPSKNDFFLASSNIEPKTPKINGFSFDDLNGEIRPESCRAKRIVIILDSCYAGSLNVSGKGSESAIASAAKNHQSTKFIEGEGRCLLSSCLGFQESFSTAEGNHSFFTKYLIEGLRGANGKSTDDDGMVTPESLMRYIDKEIDELPKDKRPEQTPFRKIELAGSITLASYPQYVRKTRTKKIMILSDILEEGNKYLSLEIYDKALEYFDKALEINPKDVSAWIGRAKAFGEMMLYEKALKCYDKVIELQPNHPNIWFYKGNGYFKDGRYEQALECFDKAIALNPADADAWYNKGCTLKKLSKGKEADYCLVKYKELRENSPDATGSNVLEHKKRFGGFRRPKTKAPQIIDKKVDQTKITTPSVEPERVTPIIESKQKAKRFGIFRRTKDQEKPAQWHDVKVKSKKKDWYVGTANQFYLASDWEKSSWHYGGIKPVFIYTLLLVNVDGLGENETLAVRIKSKNPLDALIINGDKVEIKGKWSKEGYFDATKIYNNTRNIEIKVSR